MIPEHGLPWTEEALARIPPAPSAVQEWMREAAIAEARRRREAVVTPEAVDQAIARLSAVPPQDDPAGTSRPARLESATMPWDAAAEARVRRIPVPAIRALVIRRVEEQARAHGLGAVDLATYESASPGAPPFVTRTRPPAERG